MKTSTSSEAVQQPRMSYNQACDEYNRAVQQSGRHSNAAQDAEATMNLAKKKLAEAGITSSEGSIVLAKTRAITTPKQPRPVENETEWPEDTPPAKQQAPVGLYPQEVSDEPASDISILKCTDGGLGLYLDPDGKGRWHPLQKSKT